MKIKTLNDFWFGSDGQTLQPMMPVIITNREQAFRTAAWLIAMAYVLPKDPNEPEPTFAQVQKAIDNT